MMADCRGINAYTLGANISSNHIQAMHRKQTDPIPRCTRNKYCFYWCSFANGQPYIPSLELSAIKLTKLERPAALDAKEVITAPCTLEACISVIQDSVEERAVSALSNTILLDHVRVEIVARNVAALASLLSGLLVCRSLSLAVDTAEERIEGTWEEAGAHVVATTLVDTAGAVGGCSPAWRRDWGGLVGLVVTVGADDDDLEVITPAAGVGGGGVVDGGTPKRALVVGD